jgi:sigma-B regulation protein RsbU (phosphoserine phosphatase)
MQGWLARTQIGVDSAPEAWSCDLLWGGNSYADKAFLTPGLEGHLLSVPAGQSHRGGDIHYITVCGHGVFSKFLLLDAAGHGAAAAEWSRYLHEPLSRLMEEQDNVAILEELNSVMLGYRPDNPGRFATAIAATYDSRSYGWVYAYAGHPYMLIRRHGVWQELSAAGERTVPIGIINDTEYYQSAASLQSGDWVLMFSDGATEIKQTNGRRLSVSGLINLMNGLAHDGIRALYLGLVQRLVDLNGQETFSDDLTLVLLRHTIPADPGTVTVP